MSPAARRTFTAGKKHFELEQRTVNEHLRVIAVDRKENTWALLFTGDRSLVATHCLLVFLFVLCALGGESSLAFPAVIPGASGLDLALIDAAELHKTESGWTILDARSKSAWRAVHIPGAFSFSWEDYTRTDKQGRAWRLLPSEDLALALGRMGIDENKAVAVYGDADKSMGGEGWVCWVLLWLGHKGPVRVIAGGIQSWTVHGYPVETGKEIEEKKAREYHVALRPELDIATSELASNTGSYTVVDTRSNLEWLMGHIPGAVHIPWTEFRRGPENRPIDGESLKKLLKNHGADIRRPLVYYCTGGVRSGYSWLVHQLAGSTPAKNYVGGMEDWKHQK
jgi:thiosulfate/3-mercaptopyruvate sulfurtransferase